MVKKIQKKAQLVLGVVVSTLTMLAISVSTFAYWQKDTGSFNIPTYGFNSTEEEFTYYACVPNVAASNGYDYYDLEEIPLDLVDRVTGLAVVRFEALTETAYIPSYPKVTLGGKTINYDEAKELPVIHVLNKMHSDGTSISNGFSHIKTLIIPETVTYIQEGAFEGSETLEEVSFLGKEGESGYVWYATDEFFRANPDDNSKNDIKIYLQSEHRNNDDNLYRLTNSSSYLFTQFNDEFEYDNLSKSYYTFVIPSIDINDGQIIDGVDSTASLKANTKYKISYDGSNFSVKEYTYELSYLEETVSLVLNTSTNHEEYLIEGNLNTLEILNYPTINVIEKITDISYSSYEEVTAASFDLRKLDADYSRDNNTFEIKYAPSHVYESKHYYSDAGGELLNVITLTQIGVEKAYFLNNVTTSIDDKNGEVFLTVSVPNNDYLGLYVTGKYGDGNNISYIDKNGDDKLKMELIEGSYKYEFRSSYANGNIPTSFIFYTGKNQVSYYPSGYLSSYANEDILQTALTTPRSGYTRVFLNMPLAANIYEDDHYGDDDEILYQWYLVYWLKDKEGTFTNKIYYADETSSYLIADIPDGTSHFKFARIEKEDKIEDCLKDDWKGVVNQNEGNLTLDINFKMNNIITWTGWYGNNDGTFNYDNEKNLNGEFSNGVTYAPFFYDNKQNYVILSDYGQIGGDDKYIELNENKLYMGKDLSDNDGDNDTDYDFNLEFTKFVDNETLEIEEIELPKGTKINSKIFNINGNDYFKDGEGEDVLFGYPSTESKIGITAKDNKKNVLEKEQIATYFSKDDDGSILVLKDCTVSMHLKVSYSENTSATEPLDFGWKFDIKKDSLSEFDIDVVINEGETLENPVYTTTTKEVASMKYPVLNQQGAPIKLVRNFSNTEFEEYYYETSDLSSIADSRYIIVSSYGTGRKFGSNYNNSYYGVINNTNSSGEVIVPADDSNNIMMFTPNINSSYEDTYYAAFDDYDNFLCFLSHNKKQVVNEGYQCFSIIVPQALSDYQNVFIYQVDRDGNKLSGVLNETTSLVSMLDKYNSDNGLGVDSDNSGEIEEIEKEYAFSNDNELLFEYFLNQKGSDDAANNPNFYTNNIGFSYGIEDNGDTVYYFYNIKLDLSGTDNSSERYTITTTTNRTNGQTICNNIEGLKLDEQIIDGFYYTDDIQITGDNNNYIRFKDDVFKEGYYDLALRKRNGNLYLGYKYLGETNTQDYTYYMHIYQNDQVIDVIKMNSLFNNGHYSADVTYQGEISIKIYNQQNVMVYHSPDTYTSTLDQISRFYYAVNGNVYCEINDKDENVEYKLYEVKMGKISLNFNIGEHPFDNDNIRFSPTIYTSEVDHFATQIKVDTISKYYITFDEQSILLEKHGEIYGAYVVSENFNKSILVDDKSYLLNQPGKYFITYDGTNVSSRRVQETDIFYIKIDSEEVATLYINSNEDFVEYNATDYILLHEDVVLSGEGSNNVIVVDKNDNLTVSIGSVTLDGNKVTSIPTGIYTLNYSIDSSRRENDKYYVFTYLNFVTEEKGEIIYTYTKGDSTLTSITKVAPLDENWVFEVLDYTSLKDAYTEPGKYFVGWKDVDSEEFYALGTLISAKKAVTNLVPVYHDRSEIHEVIWLSELNFDSTSDIIFSLKNLDNNLINKVTYNEVEIPDNYYDIQEGKIVNIKPSYFERIGYIEGGIPLTVYLESTIDRKITTCIVLVDYPNYSTGVPSGFVYQTSFSPSEYTKETYFRTVENDVPEIIKSINGSALDWNVNNAVINETNSKGKLEGTDETDLSLRIRYINEVYGYAMTDSLIADINTIEFEASAKIASKIDLKVSILDPQKNEVDYLIVDFNDKDNDTYYPITWEVNKTGVYYVKFEIINTTTNEHEVRIDDLKITCA